jgi:hypothetical protein
MPGQFTGNRGEAQAYIPGFIQEGLTNSEIVDILKESGLSYRASNMYSDVNRLRLEQFGAEGIKNMDIYSAIPRNLMREWQGDTEYRYRVVIQYKYTPEGGDDQLETATTLYYNDAPTINDVLEDWSVRMKTLEGGFGSTVNVGVIDEIKEINYFYNTPKEV